MHANSSGPMGLRSHKWLWGGNETGLLHRSALRAAGVDMDAYRGQPIIGIANTWSELNNCNIGLRKIAESVKAGVKKAGGIPLEFPVFSLAEELMKPSAMLYRNLLSIDVEEHLRSYPIDGVVLLGNCDKTVPGLLMGALSADLPCIQLNAGPKKVGVFEGKRLGSGTDLWKYWDKLRIGEINEEQWEEIGRCLGCGAGACNTMGTASTMNALLEVLGVMPLGTSTMPVDDVKRFEQSEWTGVRIVEMVKENLRPSDVFSLASFRNAAKLCMALGGSTNAIIHLTAMAGRMALKIYPEVFDAAGAEIPCIVDVQPSGSRLIDEFHNEGGVPQVLHRLKNHLDLSVRTFTGATLGEELKRFEVHKPGIVRHITDTPAATPTIAILYGNLAPQGAVIKAAAASPHLFEHEGKAVVFEDYQEMLSRIDDPDLAVDASSVLVLKNAGPRGVPGMPEWGLIPIPKKLQAAGVRDMVRISDARMSGTSFGTVVVHVCPEAAVGGWLALVRNGDVIRMSISQRKLNLVISDKIADERLKALSLRTHEHRRGYPSLYAREVLQADRGCDFDFLRPKDASEVKFIEPVVGRS